MPKSQRFVKQFLILSVLIITVVVAAVFFNFYTKSKADAERNLLQQARALSDEILLTRRWVGASGGVYTKLKPGESPNPYKKQLTTMPMNLQDSQGNTYLLRIPGAVVRGVSTLSETSGLYTFHVCSANPTNKRTHAPDIFESRGLAAFARGKTEFASVETTKQGPTYRYMVPLRFEESCKSCHRDEEAKNITMKTALTVNIPMALVSKQLQENRRHLLYSALAVLFSLFGSLYLVSRRFVHTLNDAQEKLMLMATTDGLTGLLNRNTGLERISEELSRASRSGDSISCMMLDLDFFKKINDTHGHLVGDRVLVETAEMLKQATRKHDIVCRYGGEEFVIVITEASQISALAVAEKIRTELSAHSIRTAKTILKVTASIGIAHINNVNDTITTDALIKAADEALYMAKRDGRNRCKMAILPHINRHAVLGN